MCEKVCTISYTTLYHDIVNKIYDFCLYKKDLERANIIFSMKIVQFILPVFAHYRHVYSDYDGKHEAFQVKRGQPLMFFTTFTVKDKGEHQIRSLCKSFVSYGANKKTGGVENTVTTLPRSCRP